MTTGLPKKQKVKQSHLRFYLFSISKTNLARQNDEGIFTTSVNF